MKLFEADMMKSIERKAEVLSVLTINDVASNVLQARRLVAVCGTCSRLGLGSGSNSGCV